MAMYGATAGKLGFLGIEAATNQAIVAFHPRPGKVSAEYLYWVLLHSRERLLNRRGGAAQPNLSRRILKDFRVPLVPPADQREIVAQLFLCNELKTKALTQSDSLREVRRGLSEALMKRSR